MSDLGQQAGKMAEHPSIAAEGAELIAANGPPELVILDLQMPVMDGADFLAMAEKRWPDLPVLVMTGYPDSELLARALAYSPVMFLSKPFETRQIQRALTQILGAGRRARESSA